MMAIPLNYTRMLLRFKQFRIISTGCTRPFCSSKPLFDESGKIKDPGVTDESQQNQTQSQDAKEKLKTLLGSMNTITASSTASKFNLSRPNMKSKKVKKDAKIGKTILKAVDEVADTLPQDKETTKTDLINKLQSLKVDVPKSKAIKSSKKKGKSQQKAAAASSSSERRIEEDTELSVNPDDLMEEIPPPKFANIEELNQIVGSMKVEDLTKSSGFLSFGLRDLSMDKMPLGIFKNAQFSPETDAVQLSTWDMLKERELRLCSTQSPTNGFEQMMRWTEQGKLWRFPINNEQGLEEEAKIGFHEHVFLEHHLEPWCPPRGPIRHFMELVCVGLSKNPYLTVAQKKDHINWFRNYFETKRNILVETGALGEWANSSNVAST